MTVPCLRLEPLEGRIAPANFRYNYVAATHSLTVVGDSTANQLSIDGTSGAGLALSSTTGAFIAPDGRLLASPFLFPSAVDNLTVKLLDGNDDVKIGYNQPFELFGNMIVDGGDGNNSVATAVLAMRGNLAVTNGAGDDSMQLNNLDIAGALAVANGAGNSTTTISFNARNYPYLRSLTITNGPGDDSTTLTDLNVTGSVAINNGTGDSQTVVNRVNAFRSVVGGNVLVTNGVGTDVTELALTAVAGNVAVRNGGGGASGNAGHTWIDNPSGPGRAVIGGNVSVTYKDGDVATVPDELLDVQVMGNVTFSHGGGTNDTILAGNQTALPAIIRGNLTFTGSGTTIVRDDGPSGAFGLVVGGNFRVTGGVGDDKVLLSRAEVSGRTMLMLGDGANTVSFDDSMFHGLVNITTGAEVDTVSIDTLAGTAAPTTFERAVSIRLGAGNDLISLDGRDDNKQRLIVFAPFVIHHGSGTDTYSDFGALDTPLGWGIEYVV